MKKSTTQLAKPTAAHRTLSAIPGVGVVTGAIAQFGADTVQGAVDVKVARLERELHQQADAQRAEVERQNAEIDTAEKARNKAITDAVEKEYRPRLEAVATAITGSGLFGAAKISLTWSHHCQPRTIGICYSVTRDVYGCNLHSNSGPTPLMAFPAEANTEQDKIEGLKVQKGQAEQKLNETRRKIAKIPQFERQIRGFIAERRFQSTQEGQDLLAELEQLQLA